VTAGVRGVGGEVKRKAVDQGYLEGWLAGWLWLWWAADKLAAPPDGNLPNKAEERRRERAISSCSSNSSSTSDQRAYRGDTVTVTDCDAQLGL
jgi:hypothetical protein